jgi:hypothetical protein
MIANPVPAPFPGPALVLILGAASIFGALLVFALTLGTLEWAAWHLARRFGVPLGSAAATSWSDWLGGVAGLLHPDRGRRESPVAALGFAGIVFGALLSPALLLWEAVRGGGPTGSALRLGLLALAPLLCALGYAIAAERADTPTAARERLRTAARITFALPAWLLAAALAQSGGGTESLPILGRATLAFALLWSGLFVLPGAVAEHGLASRTWGGDPTEPNASTRFITGIAQYAMLAGVCASASATLAGAPLGSFAGWLPSLAAIVGALFLRALASVPRWGDWVRDGRVWLVPALLLVYASAWPPWPGMR